jgi:O-antigen/teichoic acid export membrane protein
MVKVSKGFLKSTMMYTVSGALPMAAAIILLPFYLTLPTEIYGAYALYLAFSVLVQILTTYSFDTGIYVFYHDFKKDPDKLSLYISSVFGFVIILGIVAVAFFSVTGELLISLFPLGKNVHFFPFGLMSVATGVLQSLFKVHSNLLQSSENPSMFFWSNLLSFSLIAAFTIAGLQLFPETLWGPVGGRLLASLIAGAWVLLRIAANYGVKFNFAMLKSSFEFNNSSFIYQLQQWSMNYFDRFVMLLILPLSVTTLSLAPLSVIGIYDFSVKCMLAIEFIISGVYNSFYPKVIGIVAAQSEKKSTPEINRYYHGLIALIMLLVCFAILAFSLIIDLGIIPPAYQDSGRLLPLLGIVYLLKAVRYYFAFPYGALKYSKPLPFIYLAISLVKILLIVALVKPMGVTGVISASIFSTVIEIALLWKYIKGKFKLEFNKLKIIGAPVLLGIVIIIFQFTDVLPAYMVYILYIVVCVAVLGFLYRNELKLLTSGKLLRK